jgi:ribosomal protein S16
MTSKRALLVMACAVSATAMLVASRAETKRTVYVSMLDAKGAAVTDLTAADLAIKEGGQDRSIASVAESTDPMDIAILDDDDGSGFYAPAVLQFIQLLGDRAQYSITNFTPPPVKVMDYTNDVAQIQTALDKIGKRGKVQSVGEQLESAISTTARELMQRKAARRVIVAMTMGGEGQTKNATTVMDELASTGVMLNVVYFQSAKIGLVTGDGPKQTGGRIEMVGAISAVPAAVTRISNALLHQYAVTYTLPDGVKPSDRVAVITTRKNVTLLAPTRIPDK